MIEIKNYGYKMFLFKLVRFVINSSLHLQVILDDYLYKFCISETRGERDLVTQAISECILLADCLNNVSLKGDITFHFGSW